MKHLHKWLIALLMIVGIIAGCSDGTDENATEPKDDATTEVTEETEDVDFPQAVLDASGEEVVLEEEPEKIVSIMPSNTEIAFALGLGEKMVGVSDHDNYPEEVLDIEKVGGMELNVELMLSLEPDLVFAHESNGEETINQLRDAGLNVFVVNNATNFEEVYESINMMSIITGTEDKGLEIIQSMEEGFAELAEKAEAIAEDDKQIVYIEISPEPEIYAPGNHTFEQEILTLINAENGVTEDGWVMINEEAVIEMDPDVIIVTYDYVEDPVGEVINRDAWQDITAVKDERVIQVDTDLVSRPGPRLVEGAEVLAKAIYPEVFAE
ncbi:MAG TPA: ABC transporter substrate-binding protein [Bacillota bacterium]|nr:ABC transporter substrate-binding protein [Bacillota bacterium]